MSAGRLAAAALQAVLGRLLRADPEALAALEPLRGRVVALHVTGTGVSLFLRPAAGGIEVSPQAPSPPEVSLTGTPFALLTMMSGGAGEDADFGSGLSVNGDVGLAQRLRHVLSRLDADWEEQLARVLGDVPAHALGNAARTARDLGTRAGETLVRDVGEYLTEETRLLPGRQELEVYATAVDILRDDVERMQTRVRRLAAARRGRSG